MIANYCRKVASEERNVPTSKPYFLEETGSEGSQRPKLLTVVLVKNIAKAILIGFPQIVIEEPKI